jgi:hypothetical protein
MIVPTRERSQGAASTVPDGIVKIVVTGAQEDPASITWLLGYSDYRITITFLRGENRDDPRPVSVVHTDGPTET